MKVRVVRDCYQPLKPGGRPKCISLGEGEVIVDWEGEEGQPLPKCFEPVTKRQIEAIQAGEDIDESPPNLMATDGDSQVLEALNRMDHADMEQWTTDGLPLVDVVKDILGELGYPANHVTRADINVAWPGFVREL